VGIEAGWTATEVGRQPWVVHGILRTADAVTPAPGLQATFFTFTLLYVVLGVLSVMLLRRQFIVHTPDIHVDSEEGGLPHGA
jgi:cytochrome d ubiquinol oxidase subunit I